MSTERSYHFACSSQVSEKVSLKSEFVDLFHVFIHAYSPRTGQITTRFGGGGRCVCVCVWEGGGGRGEGKILI